MKTRTTDSMFLVLWSLVCALPLAGCAAAEDNEPPAEPRAPSVSDYCEAFARQYAGNHNLDYREDSVSVRKKSDLTRFIANLFSPSHSKFTAGYYCQFEAADGAGRVKDTGVDILLANTLSFAEHTQWEKLQIIPIEYVVDEANDRSGHGVFKYLAEQSRAGARVARTLLHPELETPAPSL